MLESLRANPPNFPVDVLQDLHIAICRSKRWPPASNPDGRLKGRRHYLLGGRPLGLRSQFFSDTPGSSWNRSGFRRGREALKGSPKISAAGHGYEFAAIYSLFFRL